MHHWDDISFHSRRALAELDLAVKAACGTAARAHLSLSGLHLDRMRHICRSTGLVR
jgi:hypothetical protein